MWEVSPRSRLRHASLLLSVMGFEQASVGMWPTPSRVPSPRLVRLTQQAQGACAASGEVEAEDRRDPQEGDLGLVLQSGGDSGQLG